MRAVNNKIVVVDESPAERTKGGLYVPPSSNDALVIRGKVISTGNLVNGVDQDDIIWYNRHSAFPLEIDSVKYRVLTDADVLVVE